MSKLISLFNLRHLTGQAFNVEIAKALGQSFPEVPDFERDISESLRLVAYDDFKLENLPHSGKVWVSLSWRDGSGHSRKHDETAELEYVAKALALAWYVSRIYEELTDEQA